MKIFKNICVFGLCSLAFFSCKNESKIDMNFPEKYEGKTVELIGFRDSTILNSATITDGKAEFLVQENDSVKFPLFTQIVIDGRVRAYYIAEKGEAYLVADSMSVPTGTPMNEKFSKMLAELDSVENLDDMDLYIKFAEKKYNENKGNPFGSYFGVEWLKYADPEKIDSFLNESPRDFRDSRRVKHYVNFARLRAATAPGKKYVDFPGETATGGKTSLAKMVIPGKYTLVDFWASWCPYCIKELPDLDNLYSTFKDKGLEIVGVAVRDQPEATKGMVEKKNIPWKILYNTQKTPYDIYGFSGIPHHMLIGPDGTIISRGESVEQIRTRLSKLIGNN